MTGQLLAGEVAIQPITAGAGFVGEHEPAGLGLQAADEFVDITLAGADRVQRDNFRAARFRGVCDGDGILVDTETDIQGGARLLHG
jgi:hypothetical protein